MLTKEAIAAITESASTYMVRQSVNEALDHKHGQVFAPSDYARHDLESVLPNRRRVRGTMETTSLESFAQYAKHHAEIGATVFVDGESMRATAVLNLGHDQLPGHADNLAKFKATMTAAFGALLNNCTGQAHSQQVAAEFLEDWQEYIECFDDAGTLIQVKQAVAAVRRITIEAMRKQETNEESLSASKSAFESVAATSKEPIPTSIWFVCEPYQGLPSRSFRVRLSIRTTEKPAIILRMVNRELHQQEMAAELVQLVSDSMAKEMAVMVGTYSKGN